MCINVVNSFNTIYPSYLPFFKKREILFNAFIFKFFVILNRILLVS